MYDLSMYYVEIFINGTCYSIIAHISLFFVLPYFNVKGEKRTKLHTLMLMSTNKFENLYICLIMHGLGT